MTVQPTRDQLRALADAATPHPPHESEGAWQTDRYAEYFVVDSEQDCDGEYGHVAEAANERLGAFIAAANPNTIRDLLDQLEKAEADRDWNLRSSHIAKKERIEANARAERAEQRVRDLTQDVRDERAACLDQMEQVRIRDARIKAVEDVLDRWQVDGRDHLVPGERIRRALDGEQ